MTQQSLFGRNTKTLKWFSGKAALLFTANISEKKMALFKRDVDF